MVQLQIILGDHFVPRGNYTYIHPNKNVNLISRCGTWKHCKYVRSEVILFQKVGGKHNCTCNINIPYLLTIFYRLMHVENIRAQAKKRKRYKNDSTVA